MNRGFIPFIRAKNSTIELTTSSTNTTKRRLIVLITLIATRVLLEFRFLVSGFHGNKISVSRCGNEYYQKRDPEKLHGEKLHVVT